MICISYCIHIIFSAITHAPTSDRHNSSYVDGGYSSDNAASPLTNMFNINLIIDK